MGVAEGCRVIFAFLGMRLEPGVDYRDVFNLTKTYPCCGDNAYIWQSAFPETKLVNDIFGFNSVVNPSPRHFKVKAPSSERKPKPITCPCTEPLIVTVD